MAKKSKATEPVAVSEFQLTGGAKIIGYEDGSFKFFPAPIEISAENVTAIFGGEPYSDSDEEDEEGVSIEDMKAALIESGLTKKKVNKMSDEEVEEAYGELETEEEEDEEDSDEEEDEEDSDEEEDSDDEEEEVSIEDMKAALIESGLTKKKVNKMTDEEIEEAYEELEGDDDDTEEEEEDEEDSDDDDDSDDSDDDDEDEEELTGDALAEMDFEEIEDVCDEKDLDTDPDDFEDVEKLRAAVAKELGISLPKKAKGKKGK